MSAVKLRYEEFDLSGVRTYPLGSRASKARHDDFGRPWDPATGFEGWIASLPKILAAADFSAVVEAILKAHRDGRVLLWGVGAHVIKTGLSPVVVDLMERGFVSALALNGAGLIHDFEVALSGSTSEDVDAALGPGEFGMAEETGRELNDVITAGVSGGLGLGQSVGAHLLARKPPFGHLSLVAAAARLDIPVTVHVGLGTDIIHMHPSASGESIGAGSLRDFRYLASFVSKMAGGVYLNCGSAVLLPEVFLKAVSLARNRAIPLDGLTTVNMDFLRQYRPETNVVRRPVAGIGKGYSLTGHHEIMLPLLAAAVISGMATGTTGTTGTTAQVRRVRRVRRVQRVQRVRQVRGSRLPIALVRAAPTHPRTPGPSDPRDLRTFGPSDPRTLGPSDPRTLGPSDPQDPVMIGCSAGVAQLVRACGSYPQGPGFKSLHRHHSFRGPRRTGGQGPHAASRSRHDSSASPLRRRGSRGGRGFGRP